MYNIFVPEYLTQYIVSLYIYTTQQCDICILGNDPTMSLVNTHRHTQTFLLVMKLGTVTLSNFQIGRPSHQVQSLCHALHPRTHLSDDRSVCLLTPFAL